VFALRNPAAIEQFPGARSGIFQQKEERKSALSQLDFNVQGRSFGLLLRKGEAWV
jgi:hypothetical protein